LQRMNLFRWRAVSLRYRCVDNRSIHDLAENGDVGESRQNLPYEEVRGSQGHVCKDVSMRAANLRQQMTGKPRIMRQREVLPRFLGQRVSEFFTPKIVSADQSRYRFTSSPVRGPALLFSFFSSLCHQHV
jgi:hypothetical protein